MTEKFNNYAFVIDTDQYAGNFERDMTAYLTGCIGECEVGKELVDNKINELFENSIEDVPDDSGCYRPTSCFKSPNSNDYNSVAIYFNIKPTKEQISIMKERVKNFDSEMKLKSRMAKFIQDKPPINVLGFRLIQKVTTISETKL